MAASSKSQKRGLKRILVLHFTSKNLPCDRCPYIFVDMESKNVTFHHHSFPLRPLTQTDATGIVYGKSQLFPRAACCYTCISSNLIPAKCNWCLKCQIFISPKFLLIRYSLPGIVTSCGGAVYGFFWSLWTN